MIMLVNDNTAARILLMLALSFACGCDSDPWQVAGESQAVAIKRIERKLNELHAIPPNMRYEIYSINRYDGYKDGDDYWHMRQGHEYQIEPVYENRHLLPDGRFPIAKWLENQ